MVEIDVETVRKFYYDVNFHETSFVTSEFVVVWEHQVAVSQNISLLNPLNEGHSFRNMSGYFNSLCQTLVT